MRAGEVAQRAGVNVETLRYYERRGLLPQPARMPGGHRRYDEDTVRFLRANRGVAGPAPGGVVVRARPEQALRQEADRVQLLGIDAWIGGSHITPGTAWRWAPAAQHLIKPG